MTDPRAGEESTEKPLCKCGHTYFMHEGCEIEACCESDGKDFCECEKYDPIPEERAGREATRPTPMSSRGLLDTTYTKQAEAYMNSLEAQLAAQPSVQRDEDEVFNEGLEAASVRICFACSNHLIDPVSDPPAVFEAGKWIHKFPSPLLCLANNIRKLKRITAERGSK